MTYRIALLLTTFLILPYATSASEAQPDSLLAPPFRVETVDGDTLWLKELRGKVVVLDFWHLGCVSCVSEISSLNQLVSDFEADDVVFIFLAQNARKPLTRFLRQRPFYYQNVAHTQPVAQAYSVEEFPTHFVISSNGVILRRLSGGSLGIGQKLRPLIRKALEDG